jgi:heterotetrameric sarcosine oxidase gamma subunit
MKTKGIRFGWFPRSFTIRKVRNSMAEPAGGKNKPTALQQAGIEARTFETVTLRIEEVNDVSFVRLHSLQERPLTGNPVLTLPEVTGTCSGDDPVALCLRPGEWLLLSETAPARSLVQSFEPLTDPETTAVLDGSDGLAMFRLSGPGSPWLLSKLSCLDFPGGQEHGAHCARTKMGHVAVIVHYHQPHVPQHGEKFVFDLIFDRSIAQYLWLLLTESAGHADELTKKHGAAR